MRMNDYASFLRAFDVECDANDGMAQSKQTERTTFYGSISAAVSALAPAGSTVRAIGLENVDALLRAGYRVTDCDADICVVRGGIAELNAARRATTGTIVYVPTHDYLYAATGVCRTEEHKFAVMRPAQKPTAAVLCANDMTNNPADVYGEILSLDLAAYELNFAACMRGERVETELAKEIATLISTLTAALKPIEKDGEAIKSALLGACETAAKTVERTPALLHRSGAAQVAEAYRMLCAAEQRECGTLTETETVVTAYVVDYYIKSLTTRRDFCPPPNNGKRIDSVCEYFAVDLRHATVFASQLFSPHRLKLCEYRVAEFGRDKLRALYEIAARHNSAWKVFKRLYPDDGFDIKSRVDATDIPLCLALAPDVFSADTMLSYIKQTGALERYIV